MGAGYARLWSGDNAGAREVFASVAARAQDERLSDDAKYLTGLAQWRAGDPDGARELLEEVTEESSGRSRRDLPSGGGLDPQRVIRAGFKRYRQGSVQAPVDLIVPILDLDGAALARRALHLMAAGEPPPEPKLGRQAVARTEGPDAVVADGPNPVADRSTPIRPSIPDPAPARTRRSLVWVVVATAAALLAWRLRTRGR